MGGYMAKKIRKIKIHHHDHTFEELSQEFISECERKNLSKQSIKSYESKIKLLLLCFDNQSIETLNNDTLNQQFIDWLKTNRNFSDSSTNITIKNINTFLNYINKHHQTKLHLEPIKEVKTIKPVYTKDEVKRLTHFKITDGTLQSHYAMYIATLIAINTGARINTVCHIKVSDIHKDHILFRHNKNKKEVKYPYNKKLYKIIKTYIDTCELEPDMYLIQNSEGKKHNTKSLGASFTRYCEYCNVELHQFHALRRYHVQQLLIQTKNIHLVQQSLQHSSISTTELYIKNLGIESYKTELEQVNLMGDDEE